MTHVLELLTLVIRDLPVHRSGTMTIEKTERMIGAARSCDSSKARLS